MKRFALLALAAFLALPAAAARPTDDAVALVPPDSVTAGMLRVADARKIIDRLEMILLQDVEDILRICMEFLC